MQDGRIGASIRLLRHRRGWRQVDLAKRAGVSQSAISDIERGHLDRYTVACVRRVLGTLDARGEVDVVWQSRGELDRLLDADHAAVVEVWARRHVDAGWEVWAEASYSIYGERGRIDLLCFHPASGVLEVVEVKTAILDVNETLGRLDAKARLAPQIAAERGWQSRRVVRSLVVLDGSTQRRRIEQHAAQFGTLAVRGAAARAFVRHPASVAGSGILAFVPLPPTNHGLLRGTARRRVRPRSSHTAPKPPAIGT